MSRGISNETVEIRLAHLRVGHTVLRVGRVRAQKNRVLVSQLRVEVSLQRDRRAIYSEFKSDQGSGRDEEKQGAPPQTWVFTVMRQRSAGQGGIDEPDELDAEPDELAAEPAEPEDELAAGGM